MKDHGYPMQADEVVRDTFLSSVRDANRSADELADRLHKLSERLCGVRQTDTAGSPSNSKLQAVPTGGVFNDVGDTSRQTLSRIMAAHEAVTRIEAALP